MQYHGVILTMALPECFLLPHLNFDVCLLLSCALESSYLGRLSAIKVQLELELEKYFYHNASFLMQLIIIFILPHCAISIDSYTSINK